MWSFDTPLADLPMAEQLAAMIGTLDTPGWVDDLRTMYLSFVQGAFCRDFPENENIPRAYRFSFPNNDELLLFAGARFPGQGRKLVLGYGEQTDPGTIGGPNPQVLRAAIAHYDRYMWANPQWTCRRLLIAGYSYGGAVGHCLAAYMRRWKPNVEVKVISFGAPKAGTEQYRIESLTVPHRRYWTLTDPVPQLIPARNQAVLAYEIAPNHLGRLWADYRQTGSACLLGDTGQAVEWDGSQQPLENVPSNLVGWAVGAMDTPVEAHSIHGYFIRIGRAIEAGRRFGNAPNGAAIAAPRPRREPDVTPIQRQAAIAQARVEVHKTTTALAGVPMPKDFRAVKRNGMWIVTHNGDPCVIAESGTRAKRIAQFGNQMIKQARAGGGLEEEAVPLIVANFV